jgi:hypothetical protein
VRLARSPEAQRSSWHAAFGDKSWINVFAVDKKSGAAQKSNAAEQARAVLVEFWLGPQEGRRKQPWRRRAESRFGLEAPLLDSPERLDRAAWNVLMKSGVRMVAR